MLIESHRHTAADLALWREYEAADAIHGATHRMLYKARKATHRLIEFAVQDGCYVSVSWGKDSVVVADLAHRTGLNLPFVWVKVERFENPECCLVRDRFLQSHDIDYHEIVVSVDGERPGKGILHSGFKEAARRFGRRYISGIRSDESGVRAICANTHGGMTENTCWPISRWTNQDVFGWLAARNLPVHPAYAMLGDGRWPRDRLRVATLGGERGTAYGRAEWEREFYGDILRRLESQR